MQGEYRDLFVSAVDGLKLYARDYGSANWSTLPVVCLPGLARTSADFHELATVLSTEEDHPRRVLALDYRGRGRSERDRNWRNYDVRIEANDVIQVLIAAGIDEAVFVGTSRGGLITMALSALKPSLIRGAVLNDVGPVLEGKGLARIKGYIGKLPSPHTIDQAAEMLKTMSSAQFPRYTAEQWRALARGTWAEEGGRLVLLYDPKLMRTLDALDLESPLPVLWPLFDGLAPVPVLAIRGGNSDLLSAGTLEEMRRRHPRLTAMTAPDEGHAPAIAGKVIGAIRELIRDAEMTRRVQEKVAAE